MNKRERLETPIKRQSFTSRRKRRMKGPKEEITQDEGKQLCPFDENFPKDLYAEIFSFLPFEDLLRVALVSKQWWTAADKICSWDIVFVSDITGSMSCWNEIVRCVCNLIQGYSNKRIRFGFVGYTDHDGDSALTVTKPLSFKPQEVIAFIQKLIPKGGGDYPEAVMDGLNEATNMPWRQSARKIIIHFCDAPPHGSQFGGGGDAHPNGCPCGLNEHTILSEIKRKNIKLAILNVTSEEALAPMFNIFKQIMPDLICAKATKQDLQEQLLKIIEKEM